MPYKHAHAVRSIKFFRDDRSRPLLEWNCEESDRSAAKCPAERHTLSSLLGVADRVCKYYYTCGSPLLATRKNPLRPSAAGEKVSFWVERWARSDRTFCLCTFAVSAQFTFTIGTWVYSKMWYTQPMVEELGRPANAVDWRFQVV